MPSMLNAALARASLEGDQMQPYLAPPVECFDHVSMPPEIAELLAEWPDLDPVTARLIRAAVMSREPKRLRMAWTLLAARAKLAERY